MRIVGGLALGALVLAGCASDSGGEVADWRAPVGEAVACAELLDAWTQGDPDSPQACWSFASTYDMTYEYGLAYRSVSDHLGTEPDHGPLCLVDDGERAVACGTSWKSHGTYVLLVGSISYTGLEQRVNDPQSQMLDHELTVWVSKDDPWADDEFGTYYTDPLPE